MAEAVQNIQAAQLLAFKADVYALQLCVGTARGGFDPFEFVFGGGVFEFEVRLQGGDVVG